VIDPRRTENRRHGRPASGRSPRRRCVPARRHPWRADFAANALDHDFLEQHTIGFQRSEGNALLGIPVARWAAAADVPLDQIERCTDMIGRRQGHDGPRRARHPAGASTPRSIPIWKKLLIMLTGSFGPQRHQPVALLAAAAVGQFGPTRNSSRPTTEIIAGLLPPNIFPDAVPGAIIPTACAGCGSTVRTRPIPPLTPPRSRRR